jgi:hypothetical protein
MTSIGKLPPGMLDAGLAEAARIWHSRDDYVIKTAWVPLKAWYEQQDEFAEWFYRQEVA